ncbi:unnamed protein product [Heterobilharzia americana]|nr:unnamed protein product [Heterobilharzia americana]
MDSGPRIGYRVFGLIESFMESFPYDLSVLRIYTSLLSPSNDTKNVSGSDDLLNNVKDLINHVPYLAEPLTEILSRQLSPQRSLLCPQLTLGAGKKYNNQVVLKKSRTVMAEHSKVISGQTNLPDKINIFSGVYLPSGTYGYVDQELGLVVWRVEYSLWHIIGNEIHLTELALNKLHKSITSSPQTYEAYLLPNGTSHCSEAFHIQAEYYAQFYIRLTRLLEIVNFISACLKCDFYINPCLVSLEYIWVIIMHYLNLVSSSRVDHIVQYLINTSSLIKTHQKVYESKICPDESNVNCNPVEELITSCLLPSLLSLIGCSLLNLPTITSNQLIVDNVNLLTSVLKSSTNLMPRMFINQSGKNQPLTFALSSCYLINNILGYKSSEPVTVYRPHIISPFYIRPADYGLLISYINFMSGLFFFVRWAYANSKFINENIQHGYMPLYVECSELIHGCLVFIIQCLMTTCLQVDYCLGSTNRSPSDNFLQVDFDRLANLAEHCFMLLTDVLTTRVSDQDIQILQMTLKQLKQESSSSSSNIFPKFFFEEETHWPITYQCIALHLLFNDIRSLSSLVAFSSIHLGILLRQTETIENSFPMSICPNGIDASEKTVSMCSSSPTIRAVWLALTLVHHLLGLENKLTIEPGNPNADTPLLTCIQSHYDRLTGDHYITTLFSYLRYPYSVGISRLVVALLKWIAQYSSVDLTIYLGSQLNQIRASCLKRLVSTTEDQLTRIGLYDLLSEVVLNSEKSGFVGSRLPGGLLRLFLANGSVTGGDRKLNRLMSSVEENSESDCLDCAIVTLNELQAKFTQTQLNNDKLSVVLYWSVTKFISSIYLLNMQPCIVSLKQRSTFWEILTNPLFTLLKLRESEKEALSDIENELCGNVISTLALEMYSRTNYATDESFKSFMVVMDSMVKNNLYALWFKLTRICLNKMTSHSESNDTSMERIHSRLTSLHNVTCRWKCLLLLNYNDDVSFFSDKKESNNSVNESDDFIPIAKSILDDLIECFKPLKDLPPVQPTLDVGNQLATTLTTTLSYLHKAYDMPNRNQSIERLSYNDLFNYLTKLNDLLSTFRLSVDVQVQHMHADLLASVCLLFKWYESVKLNKPEPTSEMELLKSSLFNNAVCCLSLLTRNSNRNTIEESAIKQSINVIIILWDHCGRSTLFSRLTETGVLNNILILLTECTKVKDGATLCHCLTSLLVKLVMNSSQLEYEGITITDLDESDDFLLIQQKNTIAHVIISYHEYISTAFYWPQMDTLSRWLQDSETYSNQRISLFNGDRELQSFNYNMHYDWNAVFILQIQLLCLLHDSLGGMKHPLVCSLIQNFCANNASQLEYMVTYWCLPLYTTPINDQSFVSPLPLTSVLIQQGILLTCRIRLAEVILKLYWRILVASECISTSGLPIIAPTILYSSCPRTENDRNRHRSLPSYGPSVQSELFYAIFNMIQRQIHCCSILFQRHGYKSLKGVPVSLSQVTTGVSAINSQLTPVLPRTPMANKITEVSSPHVISSISVELTDSESSELELLCLIRHLVISLSVLIVQLPMLGNTSLMTSDELRHSTVPIQLTFNSPNFGDNSVVLTFGVLIALANSLASLSSKLTYLWKSSQFSENETVQRKQELCSLVHLCSPLDKPSTRLVDKQLLTRELTAELKACHSFGISVRRTSSVSHSTAAILSRSPSNRSSSSRLLWGSASPQTPVSVPSTALKSVPLPGSSFSTIDHSNLGFDKAANRFMEFLRLTL